MFRFGLRLILLFFVSVPSECIGIIYLEFLVLCGMRVGGGVPAPGDLPFFDSSGE